VNKKRAPTVFGMPTSCERGTPVHVQTCIHRQNTETITPPPSPARHATHTYVHAPDSGPLRAVHLSRHKWPGGLVREGICCPLSPARCDRARSLSRSLSFSLSLSHSLSRAAPQPLTRESSTPKHKLHPLAQLATALPTNRFCPPFRQASPTPSCPTVHRELACEQWSPALVPRGSATQW